MHVKEEWSLWHQKQRQKSIVEVLHKCPYSQNAAIIGEVTAEQPGKVVMDDRNRNAGTSSTAGRRIAATYLLNNLKCGIGDISKRKETFHGHQSSSHFNYCGDILPRLRN